MRIVIPTMDFPPIEGGISTVARCVARALARRGHAVTVLAPWFPGMEAFDAAEPYAVQRFRGYNWGRARFVPFVRAAWPLLRNAELVLAVNVAYGGVAARLFGCRYLAFAYAYEFLKFEHAAVARAILRSVYRRAACTVAISRFTQRNVIRFGAPADSTVLALPGADLPGPVSPGDIAAVRNRYDVGDGRLVLAVGRFVPRKGQLTLVRALPRVLESCPNTHLVLVGRGPMREQCLVLARETGTEAFVHCPGYLPDSELSALYAACDIFALPNGEDEHGQIEGFGLVFTEAHAHGKAVVAGRSGGVVDAVLHEETGLLVRPDDPVALADAIVRLLADPPFAARLGENGRRRVTEELNWDRFTGILLDAAERNR